jgi:hypothetical protein
LTRAVHSLWARRLTFASRLFDSLSLNILWVYDSSGYIFIRCVLVFINIACQYSNGVRGRIHVSQATADALTAKGKGQWLKAREDKIVAKGKGEMQTYFIDMGGAGQSTLSTSHRLGSPPSM